MQRNSLFIVFLVFINTFLPCGEMPLRAEGGYSPTFRVDGTLSIIDPKGFVVVIARYYFAGLCEGVSWQSV